MATRETTPVVTDAEREQIDADPVLTVDDVRAYRRGEA